MKTNLLTHLVPSLSPELGQVGQYAMNLARQLRERHDINSQFILCDQDWNGPARLEDFNIRRLRFPNNARLWALLASIKENPTVLLHYNGHDYGKHGLPNWLYLGIHSWLADGNAGAAKGNKQFFTVFHELWDSTAKPWQGRFYLQMLQKRLVERLHRASLVSITSTEHQKAQLDAIEPRKTLLLPNPVKLSVIDNTQERRQPDFPGLVAVLVQHGNRCETTRAHTNLLRALDKANRLSGVMLLGNPDRGSRVLAEEVALLQQCVSPTRIEVIENTTHEDLAVLFNRADVFLSADGGENACKSGSVMAAMAMGCMTVLRDGRNAAPLQEGTHFIASDDSATSVSRFEQMAAAGELARIAKAGRTWYQRYADWGVIARKYQEALQAWTPVVPAPELRLRLPLLSLPAPTR